MNAGRPGDRRSRCLSRGDLQGPHRPRRAGARSRDPHRADGSRNSEPRQPAQAGHVCPRAASIIEERKDTTLSCRRWRWSTSKASAACGCRTARTRRSFAPVKLGLEDAERMEILDGLKPGDRVVTDGAASLRAGDTMVAGRRSDGGGPVAAADAAARRRAAARAGQDGSGPAAGRAAPAQRAAQRAQTPRQIVVSSARSIRSRRTTYEHSSSCHSPSGDDVHDQLRDRPARRRSR